MNVNTLSRAIVDRKGFSRDLSRHKLATADQNLRVSIKLGDNRVNTVRSISHIRKPDSDKWVYKPDVKTQVASYKSLNRHREKQNLMVFDNLEQQEANIFKIGQKRQVMRDMSLFVSKEHRVTNNQCKQSHKRIIEKLKTRDKLREELKSTNLKFYRLAKEIESLKVIMGNVGAQYQKNYAILHADPSQM